VISRHINAPPTAIYRALLDHRAVAAWRVPNGMTNHGHEFDPCEGGGVCISSAYADGTQTGKTTAHTETYHGNFVRLITNKQVVEVVGPSAVARSST